MSERLIQIRDVIARVGLRKSALYARIAADTFPRPVKDGNTSLWVEAEVDGWIAARIAARDMGRNMGRDDGDQEKAA